MTVSSGEGALVSIEGPAAADELRSLQLWLLDDDDFRGHVRLIETPAEPGTLTGGVVDGLSIAAGTLGTGLATVLVTWLKTRVGQVRVRVTRPDGTQVELAADQVRGLDAEGVRSQVGRLVDLLAADPSTTRQQNPGPTVPVDGIIDTQTAPALNEGLARD